MDETVQANFENLRSPDRNVRNQAYLELLRMTEVRVDWAYAVWDGLKADLAHRDNHLRSIASQLLCQLAVSDPEGRILTDLPALLAVTRDERFVTARHCLQSLWKIGLAGPRQMELVLERLTERFGNCSGEKHATLIRYDIIESLRKLYGRVPDGRIRERALELIETEEDPAYKKKYAAVWRKQPRDAEAGMGM